MKIRSAQPEDIDMIMEVYAAAKLFMCKSGNKNQWTNGYPPRDLIMTDIRAGNCYVCTGSDNEIVGTFFYKQGPDVTYQQIYDGKWLNDHPYGVVHRLAGSGKAKGVASHCLDWCFNQCKNIRVDTHRDNAVMRNILKKNGYTFCGIIYVANGTERLAFQKC